MKFLLIHSKMSSTTRELNAQIAIYEKYSLAAKARQEWPVVAYYENTLNECRTKLSNLQNSKWCFFIFYVNILKDCIYQVHQLLG